MAAGYHRQGEDDGPIDPGDLPSQRYEVGRENDHHPKHQEAADERKPKAAQNSGHLDEKIRPLDLLLGRAPRDIIREEVREERLGQVN